MKTIQVVCYAMIVFFFNSCSFFNSNRKATQSFVDYQNNNRLPSSNMSMKLKLENDEVKSSEHDTKFYAHDKQADKAILVIHGLHESPFFMKSISQFYFDRGYDVLSLRLSGHMSKNRDNINKVKAQHWIDSVEEGYSFLKILKYKGVDVLGYSTGGTLGMYLSLKHPNEINNLVLLAPALALSDQVFLTSTFLGWTKLDSFKICQHHEEKIICKFLLASDEQLKVMYKEGIVASPAAGFQVQKLIDIMVDEFSEQKKHPEDLKNENYYQKLNEIYSKVTSRVIMINSEYDEVVKQKFNSDFMKKNGKSNDLLNFEMNDKISHISINKSKSDAFQNSPEIFNTKFDEMLHFLSDKMNSLLSN